MDLRKDILDTIKELPSLSPMNVANLLLQFWVGDDDEADTDCEKEIIQFGIAAVKAGLHCMAPFRRAMIRRHCERTLNPSDKEWGDFWVDECEGVPRAIFASQHVDKVFTVFNL